MADPLPRPGEIAVRGEARREVEPDRAIVTFGVAGDGGTASAALDDIAPRTAALDALLDERSDGIANRVTASLVVGEEYEHDSRTGRRRLTGYRARRDTTVVVTDLDGLGRLLRDAVDHAGARVNGPWWEVPPEHAVYSEVRTAAAADARQRADAYAAGLGLTVRAVEWVRDPGVGESGGGGGPRGAMRAMAMAAPAEAAADALPVEVRAERVVVTAAVEVGFRLDSA